MVQNSIKWNLSSEKCFEIIHLTLIDILSERKDKTFPLNKLVELLNSRTKIYKLTDHKKYNSFSKYLKIKHKGILSFIEDYNFYDVIKTENQVYIKLYKNLIEFDSLSYADRRVTKDKDWVLVDEDE